MSEPLIGLTTTRMPDPYGHPLYATNFSYVHAIAVAGGVPVLIPNDFSEDDLNVLLARLSGVLFTGGYDVDPRLYGSKLHPLVKGIDPARDRSEIHMVQKMIHSGQPFFGICRGLQVINVALGGSLYEHLPEQLPGNVHDENHAKPRDYLAHTVKVEPGNQLANILTEGEIWVNSLHHQGIHRLSQEVTMTAIAPDGLVEAFELGGHPFGIAVQWHPEELQEHPAMRKLFQEFIHACNGKVQL